jgi:uncharacterized protein YfcZ (UPF0381/DUF406 family)
VNASDAMFLRVDMPGHIKHKSGDTFSEVYLSYNDQPASQSKIQNLKSKIASRESQPQNLKPEIENRESQPQNLKLKIGIPASEFLTDFPPDEKFNYRRDVGPIPKRFIRAYHLRDPKTGRDGPWLAGMTLDPSVVYEAWCHQRGYVCMIEEFGGRPIKPGESFSAAFVVGFFDSIEEMNGVYDALAGHTAIEVTEQGWRLLKPR